MSATLQEIQQVERGLLCAFIDVCNKFNLRWFLIAGSCLGAVRHQGIIPWDDDIDVAMPRDDYETFLKCAQDHLPEHIFLQTYVTDPAYIRNIAKLRHSNTTFIEASVKNYRMNHGIWLDVCPMDGYKDLSGNFTYRACKNMLSQTHTMRAYPKGSPERKRLGSLPNRLIRAWVRTPENALRRLDALYRAREYDTSDTVVNYCGAWGGKDIMPRDVFGDGRVAVFDGIEVIIPARAEEYLARVYGDNFMELPPEEKRGSLHYDYVIDASKPYTEYL